MTALAFLLLAGLAAVARLVLSAPLNARWNFPWGTLLVNVSGSAALALLAGAGPTTMTVIGSGALGAYTTFSTFAVEVDTLARRAVGLAIAYGTLTVVLCVGAAWLALGLQSAHA
jgi:CrcB protein